MTYFLASVGRGGIAVGSFLLECAQLVRGFLYWTTIAPFKGYPIRIHEAARQSVRVGVQSIPIVFLVNFFVGATLAFTVAEILNLFGATEYTAAVMGVGFTRELGPLLTAVVLSGFAGASIAAEIGAMVESEEIKALRAHALNPIRFLVVPRFIATSIMIVALTVIADYVGVLGGMLTTSTFSLPAMLTTRFLRISGRRLPRPRPTVINRITSAWTD